MIILNREQKIAFTRIISDLIEADFIVEEGEMKYFESIIIPWQRVECFLSEVRSRL